MVSVKKYIKRKRIRLTLRRNCAFIKIVHFDDNTRMRFNSGNENSCKELFRRNVVKFGVKKFSQYKNSNILKAVLIRNAVKSVDNRSVRLSCVCQN